MKLISLKYIPFLLFMMGCDCFQSVSGTVVDSKTNLALENVKIVNITTYDNEYITKEDGFFEKSQLGSGFKCPDIVLRFEKGGYEIDTMFLGVGNDKIVKLRRLVDAINNQK